MPEDKEVKLKETIGSFVQLQDIPYNSAIYQLQYGIKPLCVIDALFKAYRSLLQLKAVNPIIEMSCETMHEALANFSMFNIVDDVEGAIQKYYDAKRFETAINSENFIELVDNYINQTSNFYFKYRQYQYDCIYVINGVKGELLLLAAQLNIELEEKVDHTLRSTESPNVVVHSEAEALRKIKLLFGELNRDIGKVIHAMLEQIQLEQPELPDFEL